MGTDISNKHTNSKMEAEDSSEKLVPIKKPLRHNIPTDYKM